MENPENFTDFINGLIFAHEAYRIFHPKHITDDEADQFLASSFVKEFSKISTARLAELLVQDDFCIRVAACRVLSRRLEFTGGV